MTLHQSRQTGLARLRRLRTDTNDTAADMVFERARFDAIRQREPVAAVSADNLFQTPEPIAQQMALRLAEMLADVDAPRLLEPSAGLARLYKAACHLSTDWTLVEIAPQCAEHLWRLPARLIQDDFLDCDAQRLGGRFDGIVMNPPFRRGRDVKHIRHAMSILRPGGSLVALCYDGAKQTAKLRPLVDTWEPLPEDSFKSEGTRAGVVLVTWTNEI